MASYESTMLKLEKMAQANTATQMNWQEKMSKSSHQMEVQDLKKAGLNPVLSSNQGATAYSTSVDSAVNGIASMASAREGANASRFAARQSAAATRAAAAAQLAAARESAAAARYAADKQLEGQKYTVTHTRSSSWSGELHDILDKASKVDSSASLLFKKQIISSKNMLKNSEYYLKDPTKKWSISNMNQKSRVAVNRQLQALGFKPFQLTSKARDLYIDAMYNGKNINAWENYYTSFLKKHKTNSARSYNRNLSVLKRTGSGIW